MAPSHCSVLHAGHVPPHTGMTVSKARKSIPQGGTAMAELPSDVWGTVALAALAAEGQSFEAWTRLSLVSRAWRDGLKGARSADTQS